MCVCEWRRNAYSVTTLLPLFRDLERERKQLEELKTEQEMGLKQQNKENRLSVEGKLNTSPVKGV